MITIHYKGSSESETIRCLIAELKSICHEIHWQYTIIDDEKYTGILMNVAEKCDTLTFVFNREGRLVNVAWLNSDILCDVAFCVFVKSNFSTVDAHIAIVKLLKYIKKRYITNLEVVDEGEYYETENRELLQQKFDFLLNKYNELTILLENGLIETDKHLSADDLADRIENIVGRYFGI